MGFISYDYDSFFNYSFLHFHSSKQYNLIFYSPYFHLWICIKEKKKTIKIITEIRTAKNNRTKL